MGKIGFKTVLLNLCIVIGLLLPGTRAHAGGFLDQLESGISPALTADVRSGRELCQFDPTWLLWDAARRGGGAVYVVLLPVLCLPDKVDNVTKSPKVTLSQESGTQYNFKWWEGIFITLAGASINVINTLFSKAQPMSMQILGIGLLLWLALATLPMVSSFKEQNPADYLQKVAGMLFKAMIAAALLSSRDWFFDYLVSPIIQIAAGFVGLTDSPTIPGLNVDQTKGVASVFKPLYAIMLQIHKAVCEIKAAGILLMKQFSAIGGLMFKLVVGFSFKIFGIPINIPLINIEKELFPMHNYCVIIGGCAMWVCGVLLGIVFPLRVFDSIFRLGIILSLSPLYIVSWVFPVTQDFAKKGFTAVLQVAFFFIILYICVVLSILVIFGSIGIKLDLSPQYLLYLALMRKFINGAALLANVFVMVVATIFCLLCLTKIEELVQHFAGASFSAGAAERMAGKFMKVTGSKIREGVNDIRNKRNATKDERKALKEGKKQAKLDNKIAKKRAIYENADVDENGRFKNRKARKAETFLKREGALHDENGHQYASTPRQKKDLQGFQYATSEEVKQSNPELYRRFTERNDLGVLKDPQARMMENRLKRANLVKGRGEIIGKMPPTSGS